MLTDERIYTEASKHHYIGIDGESCYNFLDFARAIEQEATAPLQAKIDNLMMEYLEIKNANNT